MTKLDYTKPVRLKYPQPGKEDLVYKITSYNEETNRCYIQIQNFKNGDKAILFNEPISLDDIENIGTKEKKTYKAAIVSSSLALSAFILLTVLLLVFIIWLGLIGFADILGILILCLYYVVIAICCFFIVKQNPGTVWYVPILCNGMFFYFLLAKNSIWTYPMIWIPVCCGFLLTIIASMLGARRGKKDAIMTITK